MKARYANVDAKPTPAQPGGERYWIQWTRYSRAYDGCITHAVPDSRFTDKALCGVQTTEGSGAYVGETAGAEPGCIRCRKVLRKLGVME